MHSAIQRIAPALLVIGLFGYGAAEPAAAQQPRPGESLSELVRLAPDTYMFRAYNYTSLFVVTDEGVVVVDPIGQSNRANTAMLQQAIRSATEQPVRYLIYSHANADHAMGAHLFEDAPLLVSTAVTAERLAEANDPTRPLPDITFDQHLSIDLGGKTFDLYPTRNAPNDDYLIFHYPDADVVMTVDFVRPGNPPFQELNQAHPDWIIDTLQWIDDNLAFTHLVWGHGNVDNAVGTREDVRQLRQYYIDLAASVRAARAAGLPDNSEEMVARVQADLEPRYGTLNNFATVLPRNIAGAVRWFSQP
jgi:glyoxylase-like metal-dependent hydrolase (beta-lactamase superfamily II)